MNTGACPNKKCDEFIEFSAINSFPTKCIRCTEEITEKHYQQFKDIMQATRSHLDSLKMSNIACKYDLISESLNFHNLNIFLNVWFIFLFHPTDLDVCSILVNKQRGVLHRFNVLFLKTLDLAFESAIDVAKWDLALEYGHELLPGFRLVCKI